MTENSKNKMFDRIIASGVVIKQQQRDEPDLNQSDKYSLLDAQLNQSLQKFLEKYSNYMNQADLALLEDHLTTNNVKRNDILDFYFDKIRHTTQAAVKNRRYEALQRLVNAGEYFNDESMKAREPLLYEQMIEKYGGADVEHTSSASSTNYTRTSHLTNFFMSHLDSVTHAARVVELKNEQNKDEDEGTDDDDDDEKCESDEIDWQGDDDEYDEQQQKIENERNQMRTEFTSLMHRKFLNGEDSQFDYTQVDYNDDYDNNDLVTRDKEEKYFDQNEDNQSQNKSTEIGQDYDY